MSKKFESEFLNREPVWDLGIPNLHTQKGVLSKPWTTTMTMTKDCFYSSCSTRRSLFWRNKNSLILSLLLLPLSCTALKNHGVSDQKDVPRDACTSLVLSCFPIPANPRHGKSSTRARTTVHSSPPWDSMWPPSTRSYLLVSKPDGTQSPFLAMM